MTQRYTLQNQPDLRSAALFFFSVLLKQPWKICKTKLIIVLLALVINQYSRQTVIISNVFHSWNCLLYRNFCKMGGGDGIQIFFIKRGVGKIGGCFKKVDITYFLLTNPFQCLVCVFFCLFTSFLSVLFVFHRKNLVLLHLLNRYMTYTSE